MEFDNLFSRPKAAKYLGVQPDTMKVWASIKKYNIPYIKVGGLVKYRKEDLDIFLKERTIRLVNQ